MKNPVKILPALLAVLWPLACATTEDVVPEPAPLPPPAAPTTEPPQRVEFNSQTDTVAIGRSKDGGALAEDAGHQRQIRFMVQIGAFQSPQLGAAFQATARERFKMPVLNDYHPGRGLYQIRIGFFETREAAFEFRATMQREYPEDYRDAWVVQLER